MWLQMWKRRFLNEFPRLGKSFGLCLATAPGLGCLDAQEGMNFPTKHLPNEFSQAEKIIWPLSGRTCGFGKAAWGESAHDDFSEGHKKHLACLVTDVDEAVEEETPQ